jgi:hypothetical protein
VLAREDLDGGAGEFGGDLVEATGADTLLLASDVEGADGRMVGGLLGQIRDADRLALRGRGGVLRNGEGDGR